MMDMPTAIAMAIEGNDLSQSEMTEVMQLIMTGEATPAQIGGFLVGLRIKGESVDEITGAAIVMRSLATPVHVSVDGLIDTCGTGGSGSNKFNVSTASAFVAAAAGARVAKHGNRGASSKSGSADLLEAAGANIMLSPEQVARCIDEVGVGFLFAVSHHGAMKHAIGPRREMVVRTIFNLLGPLTNPAKARRQLLGVYDAGWLRPMAEVLRNLGSEHVLVVHSDDGLDEISIAGPTRVAELKDGEITEYVVEPARFGCSVASIDPLRVENAAESLVLVRAALKGDGNQAATDMVVLNAGAAIYTAGLARDLGAGVEMARDAIGSGLAGEKLKEFVNFTQQVGDDGA
jgi:anthranilate phosphoribosyltransferase